MAVTRCFIAVELDARTRKRIAGFSKLIEIKGLRPVPEDNLHITMMFLGGIGSRNIADAKDMLSAIVHRSFRISIVGLGVTSASDPRVVVARVHDGAEELSLIHEYLKAGVSALGLRTENRKFFPHVTIARTGRSLRANQDEVNNFVALHSGEQFGSFVCDGIKLKSSVLTPAGPVHSDLFKKEFSAQ